MVPIKLTPVESSFLCIRVPRQSLACMLTTLLCAPTNIPRTSPRPRPFHSISLLYTIDFLYFSFLNPIFSPWDARVASLHPQVTWLLLAPVLGLEGRLVFRLALLVVG